MVNKNYNLRLFHLTYFVNLVKCFRKANYIFPDSFPHQHKPWIFHPEDVIFTYIHESSNYSGYVYNNIFDNQTISSQTWIVIFPPTLSLFLSLYPRVCILPRAHSARKCQELLPTKESEYLGESPSDCKGQILSHELEYSKLS